MADLSVAVIVGRLTRDAELRYTNSGQAVCHFAVATSSRKKKGDQWVDESNFWDVDFWGKQGESISQYLTKGKLVAVEGNMRQDRWEQDGQQRMKIAINANTVQLLGAGGYSGGGQKPAGESQNSYGNNNNNSAYGYNSGSQAPQAPAADDFTDDVPF